MESIMLTVKFVIFFALEFFVLSVLVAALYQVVQDKIRESRRLDGVTPEARHA